MWSQDGTVNPVVHRNFPWTLTLKLYLREIFTFKKADILISLNGHKCAIIVFAHYQYFPIKYFFFCTLILNATINSEHAALHTKDYCKTGTVPPHDITSGKGLQLHCCQSGRESQSTLWLCCSSTRAGKSDQERETALTSTLSVSCGFESDITVVQIDLLMKGSKFEVALLPLQDSRGNWLDDGAINISQCLVRNPVPTY